MHSAAHKTGCVARSRHDTTNQRHVKIALGGQRVASFGGSAIDLGDGIAPEMPEDLVELLTNGIEEALCRGFLNDDDAVGMAVRRAELLIGENITLPLARDKERVWQLIREKEEDDWKGIVDAMGAHYYFE